MEIGRNGEETVQRSSKNLGGLIRLSSRTVRSATLMALLCLSAILSLLMLQPPAPVSANAPLTVFSAERALVHVSAIANQSRAVGTPGHFAAQQYLLDTIATLGLEPEIQATTTVQRWPQATQFGIGSVENILVRLPGTDSTGAIAINGHYDSGSNTPGAADCGACVGALLETLRALRTGPPLQNDVIFVFADSEENGDLGAHAFTTQHPWQQDVRLAFNLEATGNAGPNLLYSTHRHNYPVIAGFIRAAPHPIAHSFAIAFARWMPSLRLGCDLEEYLDRGSAGLGFALTGNTTGYHTAVDNVSMLSQRSLQHEGETTLALVRYFGGRDLTKLVSSQDAVYFNLLPQVVVYYSTAWVMPLIAAVLLIYGFVIGLGLRSQQLTIAGISWGAIAFVASTAVTLMVATALWWGIKTANPNLQVVMVGHYRTTDYFLGLALFAVALMTALQVWLRKWMRGNDRTAGALLIWLALMLLSGVMAPFASYLFMFPLLFGTLLLGWQMRPAFRSGSWQHILYLTLVAFSGMLLLLPAMAHPTLAILMRFEAFAPLPLLALALVFVLVLMGLLVPHVELLTDKKPRWILPGLLLLASITVLTLATLTSGFDARHPRPNSIAYVLNLDSGKAAWVSVDHRLDDWTEQFFPDPVESQTYEFFPGVHVRAFTTTAPNLSLAAPKVILLDDSRRDTTTRFLQLRLSSPRQAVNLNVQLTAVGPIEAATVNGKTIQLNELPASKRNQLIFDYFNVPQEGLELILAVQSAQPIQLVITDTTYGLPQPLIKSLHPRSEVSMPSFWGLDPTYVRKTFQL